jgi:uncharacterized membrane protein
MLSISVMSLLKTQNSEKTPKQQNKMRKTVEFNKKVLYLRMIVHIKRQ